MILSIDLNIEEPLAVAAFPREPRKVTKKALPSSELGGPFRLRFAWDLTGDVASLRVSINGEPLLDPQGGALAVDIPKEEFHEGIDYVCMFMHNAILGRITVSE